jgi:hypothetical protein
MWILNFIPDSVLYFGVMLLICSGLILLAVGQCMRFIPAPLVYTISPYKTPINIASVVLLVIGIYFYGGYSTEMVWRERVKEVEAKVAKAEAESKTANDKLVQKSKQKVVVIKQKAQIVKQYIDREITKYDNTCVVPNEFVKAHNAAAKNEGLK